MDRDYYAILGVSKRATAEEIKQAYRRLVRQYHPDHNPDAPTEHIQEINEAYAILSDAQKRRSYDLLVGWRYEPPPPSGSRPSTASSTPSPQTSSHEKPIPAPYPDDANWGKLFYYLGLMALVGLCQIGFLVARDYAEQHLPGESTISPDYATDQAILASTEARQPFTPDDICTATFATEPGKIYNSARNVVLRRVENSGEFQVLRDDDIMTWLQVASADRFVRRIDVNLLECKSYNP